VAVLVTWCWLHPSKGREAKKRDREKDDGGGREKKGQSERVGIRKEGLKSGLHCTSIVTNIWSQ